MCASPDEFAGPLGYIVSAILIPVGELAGRDRELSHDRPIVAAGAATLSFAASNPPDDNKEHFSRGVAPYQDPHPPLFQPFSVSENTIRYTAQSGIVPRILVSYPPEFQRLCRVYREVAAEAGRKLALGESVGAFRAVHFGRTEEEAVELFRQTNYQGFANYFGGFGFAEAFRLGILPSSL